MAKQEGPLYFEGTLGGINFYFLEGEALARRSGGGFTREAIKNGPHMEKVRESNSEFGGCSKVNKEFKKALQPYLEGYRDGSLHRRLMQLFLKIKELDLLSERGKRSVHQGIFLRAGKQLLKDFVFTPQRSPVLGCSYGFDWNILTFKVSDFNVDQVPFPKGSDYMEVLVGLIRFDFVSLDYQQSFAKAVVLARNFTEDSFEIILDEVPQGKGILFSVVRVLFYQTNNGKRCLLPGGDAYGVEVLSVWDEGSRDQK